VLPQIGRNVPETRARNTRKAMPFKSLERFKEKVLMVLQERIELWVLLLKSMTYVLIWHQFSPYFWHHFSEPNLSQDTVKD
jgi:hypothetical protein